MNEQSRHLDTLRDIKKMMERSSRFISLSGLSGITAGACALVGAWFANKVIEENKYSVATLKNMVRSDDERIGISDWKGNQLIQIAAITFISALVLSFIFTYIR